MEEKRYEETRHEEKRHEETRYIEDLCKALFCLAAPYLKVRGNQEHTEIAFSFASDLQEELGGRKEIIFPTIILHDVGWSALPEELHLQAFGLNHDPRLNRIHEIEGAKIAAALLKDVPLSQPDKEEICRIILSHDSGQNPITLEEKIVKDADKLYRFSPVGFTTDVQRFKHHMREYWHKLHELRKEWLFTEYARSVAAGQLKKLEEEVMN